MNNIFKYSLPLLLLGLANLSYSQVVNKREKTESFPAAKGTTLEVENKYGNIHISNWDTDSVYVKMQMVVTAKNKDKLEKTLRDIHFDFRKSAGFITIKTSVDISTFGQISEEIFKSNEDVKINYYIKAPSYIDIRLENKFGNIYLEKIENKADIVLSHGDLKAKRIDGRLKLELSFGDGDINYVKSGYLDLNYADLKIDRALFLDLTSKSSDVFINEVDKVVLDARRGDIELSSIITLTGQSTFSDIEIGSISKELNMEMQYGALMMEKAKPDFSLINIQSKYTDIDLFFENGTSFDFDMSHRKSAFIYSKNKATLETKNIDSTTKKEYFNTYGHFGNSANTKSKVRLDIENGDLKINFH